MITSNIREVEDLEVLLALLRIAVGLPAKVESEASAGRSATSVVRSFELILNLRYSLSCRLPV